MFFFVPKFLNYKKTQRKIKTIIEVVILCRCPFLYEIMLV